MKTRQMSLLRLLSVMVLLLFAAPMMDGVLTLFQSPHFSEQSPHFSETSFFETSVYAHPSNPSLKEKHTHKLREFWDKCKDCSSKITKYAVYAVWIAEAISGSGGSGSQSVEMIRKADKQIVIATKECTVEVCPPPPPPGNGGNDGGNDGD